MALSLIHIYHTIEKRIWIQSLPKHVITSLAIGEQRERYFCINPDQGFHFITNLKTRIKKIISSAFDTERQLPRLEATAFQSRMVHQTVIFNYINNIKQNNT